MQNSLLKNVRIKCENTKAVKYLDTEIFSRDYLPCFLCYLQLG